MFEELEKAKRVLEEAIRDLAIGNNEIAKGRVRQAIELIDAYERVIRSQRP